MKKTEEEKWESAQKQGFWPFLIQNAVLMGVGLPLVAALVEGVYRLLKQDDWQEALQQLDWGRFVFVGLVTGAAVSSYQWRKYEKSFGAKQS